MNVNEIRQSNFCSFNSNFLSKTDCKKIEEYVINKNKILKDNISSNMANTCLVLNPNYIYQETYPWIPPFYAKAPNFFELGDRVVNIRSNDVKYVPFGEKGTVTAITEEFLEIMFDNEFIGGSTCTNRFSNKRGAYVSPLNLINLTQ